MKNNPLRTKVKLLVLDLLAVLMLIASFTAIVIPMDRQAPELWGLPYTLWVGILMSLAFVAITWIGAVISNDES